MPILVTTLVPTPPAPPVPPAWVPPAPPPERSGFAMSWVGVNDVEWDLADVDGGAYLGEGVRGLGMPDVTRWTTTAARVAGSAWRGHRVEERTVFWPLTVYHPDGDLAWAQRDRLLWAGMRPDATGTWTVTRQDGQARTLRLRWVNDGDWTPEVDPALTGWVRYGVTLVAEQPYWEGTPLSRTFAPSGSPPTFFSGTGVITIASGNTLGAARIDNPGDVPGWVVWTLTGPFSSASVGVNGRMIEVPTTLPAGRTLTLYTQPDLMSLVDDTGVDVTETLGAAAFAPVPPGRGVPLQVSMAGNAAGSAVTAELTPLHYRAW